MNAPVRRGARKGLSQLMRDGCAVMADVYTTLPYYSSPKDADGKIVGIACDPLLLAFVGKFGTRLIDEVAAEMRTEVYTEARVWDREQVVEKITRAINGGLPEVHRRLLDYPKLYDWLCTKGFRHLPGAAVKMRGPQGVSVYRAITFMTNPLFMTPYEIADKLEEHRL